MNARRGTPVEIAYWLGTRRVLPNVVEVIARWDVSRATAFRWVAFARSGGRSQSTGPAGRIKARA